MLNLGDPEAFELERKKMKKLFNFIVVAQILSALVLVACLSLGTYFLVAKIRTVGLKGLVEQVWNGPQAQKPVDK